MVGIDKIDRGERAGERVRKRESAGERVRKRECRREREKAGEGAKASPELDQQCREKHHVNIAGGSAGCAPLMFGVVS